MSKLIDNQLNQGRPIEPPDYFRLAISHQARWRTLSRELLPVTEKHTIWLYSRCLDRSAPRQGWKIHISATILTACNTLEKVAHYLHQRDVTFKAPSTLDELAKLNSGLWYGYSQVGKFITIYPSDIREFRRIVIDLDRILSGKQQAPVVPFDLRFRADGNIYYRYGAFVDSTTIVRDQDTGIFGRTPPREELEDRRDRAAPPWIDPPFPRNVSPDGEKPAIHLSNKYLVLSSLSQRGKGGVYEAIHLEKGIVGACIIKEGRLHGETSWDGRDGNDRLKQEKRALNDLTLKKVNAPAFLGSFETDANQYVVIEKLEGVTLQEFVTNRSRRLSLRRSIEIGCAIAGVVANIHAAGWVWRDCKPSNLFVQSDGSLRPIDFEGSTRIEEPDLLPWNTPNYSPPEIDSPLYAGNLRSNIAEDLYSLGACLYFVLEGHPPKQSVRSHPGTASRDCNRAIDLQELSSKGGVDAEHGSDLIIPSVEHPGRGGNPILAPESNEDSARSITESKSTLISFTRKHIPGRIRSVVASLLDRDPDKRPSAAQAQRKLLAAQRHCLKNVSKSRISSKRIK